MAEKKEPAAVAEKDQGAATVAAPPSEKPVPEKPGMDPVVRLASMRELASELRSFEGQVRGIHDEARGLLVAGKPAEAAEREKALPSRRKLLADLESKMLGLMEGRRPDEDTVGIYESECKAALQNSRAALEAAVKLFTDGVPKTYPPEYVAPAPRPPDRPNESDTFIVYLEGLEGEEVKLNETCSVYGNRKARLSLDELRLLSKRVEHLVEIPKAIIPGGLRIILATNKTYQVPPEDTLKRVAEARVPAAGK